MAYQSINPYDGKVLQTFSELDDDELERALATAAAGAKEQRLLWASTGSKDPAVSDTLYVEALAAPDTIDTIPEKTLLAFADHGQVTDVMPLDGVYGEALLTEFSRAGIDGQVIAADLQRQGVDSFAKSWADLMSCLAAKTAALTKAGQS